MEDQLPSVSKSGSDELSAIARSHLRSQIKALNHARKRLKLENGLAPEYQVANYTVHVAALDRLIQLAKKRFYDLASHKE